MTALAPSQNTAATPPNTRVMTRRHQGPRADARQRGGEGRLDRRGEARRRRSLAAEGLHRVEASRVSPAKATASAKRSWALAERRRTRRPKRTSGASTSGDQDDHEQV